jgi:putative serine protease PepD
MNDDTSVADDEAEADDSGLRIEVEGRTVTLRDEPVVQIGRDVPDGIVVRGSSVSRIHAELRRTGTTWSLVDLGSRNGTFIDGQRIDERRISAPVTVNLGPPESGSVLVIHPESPPPVHEEAPAGMNAAYAETMVAPSIDDLDLDHDAQPSGPNLVVQVGTARVSFPHADPVSVGRMPDNDVVVADPACSRIHGYVEPTASGWTYRNVSTHGTFHRGEPVETLTLEVPTVLKLGHPETGPRLELSHRGMVVDPAPEPIDPRKVFAIGQHRISRRLVYGIVVVALYLAGAAWAVTYCDAREAPTRSPAPTVSSNAATP